MVADVDDLDDLIQQKVDEATEELREENEKLRERVEELECEAEATKSLVNAAINRTKTVEPMISELQSRELEKGAHLLWTNIERNVEAENIDIDGDQIERITKDDGRTYGRLPGEEDCLMRGGTVAHSTADLLPLQRLARYDDEMLASVTKCQEGELAAKAWRKHTEHGRYDLWSKGSGDVFVYPNSSDLAEEIRSQRAGISKKYSQELARRTMDAMLALAKGRLCMVKKTRRKDGLSYKERRIVLKKDVDLPGKQRSASAPATHEVVSE